MALISHELSLPEQSYLNQLMLKDRERLVALAKSRAEDADSALSKSHKPLSHSNPRDCDKENRNPMAGEGSCEEQVAKTSILTYILVLWIKFIAH